MFPVEMQSPSAFFRNNMFLILSVTPTFTNHLSHPVFISTNQSFLRFLWKWKVPEPKLKGSWFMFLPMSSVILCSVLQAIKSSFRQNYLQVKYSIWSSHRWTLFQIQESYLSQSSWTSFLVISKRFFLGKEDHTRVVTGSPFEYQ